MLYFNIVGGGYHQEMPGKNEDHHRQGKCSTWVSMLVPLQTIYCKLVCQQTLQIQELSNKHKIFIMDKLKH